MAKSTVRNSFNKQFADLSTSNHIDLFRSIWESTTDYTIIATDMEGTILTCSEGALRNYGYAPSEIIGKLNIREFHCPEDVASGKVDAFLEMVEKTGKVETEFERIRKNGERFLASVTCSMRRDKNGSSVGFVLISKDITQQKRLENQLRMQNEALETQAKQIKEANRLKSEFLANMSHELRTPLNGIIGFSELMYNGKVGPISDSHKEYLGDILTSSRHLLQLINDVLDLAKIEAGKMEFHPEPVILKKMIDEISNILCTLIARKQIKLKITIDPNLQDIVIDPVKFKQVLYNYVSNAIKFSNKGGEVTIQVKEKGTEHFILEVIDNGIGISEEQKAKLFIEFQQLDSKMSKKYQGTGLGLALTRRMVEAQQGSVGVESRSGKGSSFFAVLPRKQNINNIENKQKSPPKSLATSKMTSLKRSSKVLVIEDETLDVALLKTTLINAGYNVTIAKNGTDAINFAKDTKFDAITLDLFLPDMSGWDILRAIRAEGKNIHTPTIVVTIVGDKGIVNGYSIHDFLIKPVERKDLLSSLYSAGILPHKTKTILIVDDDLQAIKLVKCELKDHGFRLIDKQDALSALECLAQELPDIILLDLIMPDIDGFEFLRRLRSQPIGQNIPVIVWTVKDLNSKDLEKLRTSAQAVIQKGNGSMNALLKEFEHLVLAEKAPFLQL